MAGDYRGGAPRPGDHGQKTSRDTDKSRSSSAASDSGAKKLASGSVGRTYRDPDLGGQVTGYGAPVHTAMDGPGKGTRTAQSREKWESTKAAVSATKSKPGGGTTTSWDQSPGAVPNNPNANPLTELPKAMLLGPGGIAAKVLLDTVVDGQAPNPYDAGPQRGWQPDRFKGKANLTGVGDPGSASGLSSDEREIVGRPLRAVPNEGAAASQAAPGSGTVTDAYSDVLLADRRKPYTSLKQMLETML